MGIEINIYKEVWYVSNYISCKIQFPARIHNLLRDGFLTWLIIVGMYSLPWSMPQSNQKVISYPSIRCHFKSGPILHRMLPIYKIHDLIRPLMSFSAAYVTPSRTMKDNDSQGASSSANLLFLYHAAKVHGVLTYRFLSLSSDGQLKEKIATCFVVLRTSQPSLTTHPEDVPTPGIGL